MVVSFSVILLVTWNILELYTMVRSPELFEFNNFGCLKILTRYQEYEQGFHKVWLKNKSYMNIWPVFRSSGSFFSWTANKSVWHCGLHNNFSNCRLSSLLGQSFSIDVFLNSILFFSYFPVPAPDELGWSLLHWFEWAGVVQWTRRANPTDWKQYPLHTKHRWPRWCTV